MHLRSRLLERSSSLFQKNLFQKNPPFNILDQLHVSITSFVRSNNIQRCKFSWERREESLVDRASLVDYLVNAETDGQRKHVTPRRSLAVDWNDRGRNTESVALPRPPPGTEWFGPRTCPNEILGGCVLRDDEFYSRKVYADI